MADSQNQNVPSSPPHSMAPIALVGIVALLAVAGFVAWRWNQPDAKSDSEELAHDRAANDAATNTSRWDQLVQSSPYLNVRSGVKYVNDTACADCHAEIAEAYATHPMGRSLSPTVEAQSIERFTTDARLPLKVDSFAYEIRREGQRQFHRETRLSPDGNEALTQEFETVFSVGSGRTGRSYLIERDNHLFMSPLTWYPDHGWDLSPGYEVNNSHFNRPVVAECLFCHSNRYHHVEGTLNEYNQPVFSGYAIGCQRCHGPGELHVAAQQAGTADDKEDMTIVNPARLSPALSESICQQCHLGGLVRMEVRGRRRDDFRPGLPWDAVEAVYLTAGSEAAVERSSKSEQGKDVDRFVGHVEQVHLSGCYVSSGGKLGCTSCHDPHRLPAEPDKVEFYRKRCLECHGESDCSLPLTVRRERQADDSCYACHMPRAATQIQHAAATDHRIPRSPTAPHRRPPSAEPAWLPLVAFQTLVKSPDASKAKNAGSAGDRTTADDDRNLAVALARTMDRYPALIDDQRLARAIELLEQAVKRDANDVDARDAYAFLLARSGKLPLALKQMEEVIRHEPRTESALAAAASMLMSAQNWTAAAGLWEQARDVNPWIVRYWSELALCYARLGRWADCGKLCQEAIKRFPDSFGARQLLIESYLFERRAADAQREYERMIELNPPKVDTVRRWWDNHPLRKGAAAGGG